MPRNNSLVCSLQQLGQVELRVHRWSNGGVFSYMKAGDLFTKQHRRHDNRNDEYHYLSTANSSESHIMPLFVQPLTAVPAIQPRQRSRKLAYTSNTGILPMDKSDNCIIKSAIAPCHSTLLGGKTSLKSLFPTFHATNFHPLTDP